MDAGQLIVLAPHDTDGFESLVAIYQSSIDPAEQKPVDDLKRMFASTNYLFAALRLGDQIRGFAIVFIPDSRAFWMLEYMAIESGKRASGLGQRLFSEVAALLAVRCSGGPGLIEVDRPIGAHDVVARAQKRLRFYRLVGCRAIAGLVYRMPPLTEAEPPPMYLLAFGLDNRASVTAGEVHAWLEEIYSGVYGKNRSDPRIGEMLQMIKDPAVLTPAFD